MTHETLIDDLLDAWEDARERGTPVSVDALCADHPQLRDEIQRRIDALQQMDERLEGTSPIVTETGALQYESKLAHLMFHAKGGLGSVFVGEDLHLNRQVAIKFIHRNLAHDSDSRARFELEAEITGRLEHPGVIPLYGAGQAPDGRLFYAMRFVDGHSLDEAIRRHFAQADYAGAYESVPFRRLLHSFVAVCETIAYAHTRGIVHRDIKPDNIMLGRYGETIVVDWGLACTVTRDAHHKLSGEKTLLPRTGSSGNSSGNGAGTPAYMSPEQASELAPTPASDLYSLGATLFKLITGIPPITGESLVDIKARVIDGRIPRPSEIRREVPRSLEAICRKAMSLRPRDRYATALDLARDVESYLADERVEAYAEPFSQRCSRWLRRYRSAATAAFVGLLLCLVVAGLSSFWLAHAARRETLARRDAEQAQLVAENSRRETLGSSAMFLAKSLAQEIDLRWRIQEAEASSPTLRQLLQAINEQEQAGQPLSDELQLPLQSWLEKRYIANSEALRNPCWCVYSLAGTQVARVPEAASLGRNFQHRDYFHGEGKDLTPEEATARAPIEPLAGKDAYISAVFQSTNTRTLMVTFSVPIWSDPPDQPLRERIGVFALPVELGDFALGSHALVADTRRDQLNQRAGLLLHHPRLRALSKNDELPYLSNQDLDRSFALRQDRKLATGLSGWTRTNVFDDFIDPIGGQPRLAAIEPVVVRGRNREIGDSGWVVIVIEDE